MGRPPWSRAGRTAPMALPTVVALIVGTLLAGSGAAIRSTVFTHGEGGFVCIRAPGTLALPFDVMLSFAAARSWSGDFCFPNKAPPASQKRYSAHVVKRSTDRGASWGPMTEIARGAIGEKIPGGGRIPGHEDLYGYKNGSPEGCNIYSNKHQTVVTIFALDNVSDTTTGLRLWQSETDISGISWSTPHPVIIRGLHKDNVTSGTHIAPGNGIELQHGPQAGRMLNVLILESGCALDAVIYSDDGGKTWQMSDTPLPHNGEAQLAEVRKPDGSTAILFSGRSNEGSHTHTPRGIAWSYDSGATFTDVRIADDLTAGITCLATVLSLDQQPVGGAVTWTNGSSLIFSHPSSSANRSAGVLLRSDDDTESWKVVGSATPEDPRRSFGYSMLNSLPQEDSATPMVGLTYETGAAGCAARSSACKIVYRTFAFGGE